MSGNDVDVGVAHRDERLVEITALADLTGGPQQTPVRRALESLFDGIGAHYGRSVVDGGLYITKSEGPRPVVAGEALHFTERLSRCGKRRLSALHLCQTSLLPKANKPYSNKEEGQNDAEKELAADHVLNLMMFVRM